MNIYNSNEIFDSNLIKNKVIVQLIDPEDKQYVYEISLDIKNLTELYLGENQLTEIKENTFFGLLGIVCNIYFLK